MNMRGRLLGSSRPINGALWHVEHVHQYNGLFGLPGKAMAILDRNGATKVRVDYTDTDLMIIVDGPFAANGYAFYDVIVPDGRLLTLCTFENEVLE